jgi:hypothetical protein
LIESIIAHRDAELAAHEEDSALTRESMRWT